VQFEALDVPGQMAIGEVQPDGAFTLNTFVDGHKLAGVVLGPQRVTYIPQDTQGGALPVTLPQTVTVAAGENEFALKLP
jgi:hypothetical protein